MTLSIVQMRSMLKTKLSYHDRLDRVWSNTKSKQDNKMTDVIRTMTLSIVQMRSMLKTKLSYHDRLNRVWIDMKSKQDNKMTDLISLVYVEIETELSRPFFIKCSL